MFNWTIIGALIGGFLLGRAMAKNKVSFMIFLQNKQQKNFIDTTTPASCRLKTDFSLVFLFPIFLKKPLIQGNY
jgi:hypothetical protein